MVNVTFVTAVKNIISMGRGDMLERCVKSVADVRGSEHLVIDGGSLDGTVDFLDRLGKKYPRLRFVSEPDNGIYDALNKGVRLACGEWVHVLGCDDYILNAKAIERVLKEASNPNCEIIIAPVEKEAGGRSINLKACLYSIPYCHQGALMKRTLFERLGGFDDSLKLAGDYDFTLRAHLGGAGYITLPYKFAYYATGGASCNWEKLHAEISRVAARQFSLTPKETDHFDKTRCLPFRVIVPLLLHKKRIIRCGAAWQLLRNILVIIGVKR